VGSLEDDLDNLTKAQIEALVAQPTAQRITKVHPADQRKAKLAPAQKKPIRRSKRVFEPELVSINDDMVVEVKIPAYQVAVMRDTPEGLDAYVRMAVRDRLLRDGIKWAYPRFLMALEGNNMLAKIRFTARSRLE
jgi:hypothetical protein